MLAALYPTRVRRLILFAPANPYSRSSDVMVRMYSTAWGAVLACMLPYLPAPIQRIALGEMYGGADRVLDRCLQEIIESLRSPVTLRHVLCVIRCWCAEMAVLEAAIHRVKRIPTLLIWGDRDCTVSLGSALELKHKLRDSELIVTITRASRHDPFTIDKRVGDFLIWTAVSGGGLCNLTARENLSFGRGT